MELIIKKDQDKGFLGGMKFVLEAKVKLTSEEEMLVKKYKAHKEILFTSEKNTLISDYKRNYTITDLTIGVKEKAKNVSDLLQYEDLIISVCESLKTLLNQMKYFGGERKYDFNEGKIK